MGPGTGDRFWRIKNDGEMTQDEKWMVKYQEVMKGNKRMNQYQ